MTIEALNEILKEMKLPVAYNHFKSIQNPPYLIYFCEGSHNFGADNKVYQKNDNFVMELYTSKKDSALETQLEELLNLNELYYEKYEAYIDIEKMYQVRYEI